MSRPAAPFEGIERLYLDGNNLLHRTAGAPDPTARRLLVARLRALLPPTVSAVVALDGQPDPGQPMRQAIDARLEVRHAGREDADGLLVALVAGLPFGARAGAVVVTDDRELTERIRHAGGRTRRLAWLVALLEGPPGPVPRGSSVGQGRPPRPGTGSAPGPAAPGTAPDPAAAASVPGAPSEPPERPPWKPGRGATRKRGNPRRGH